MYYNISQIMTYEQPIKMVVGGRGIGKTYSLKEWLLSRKIKNPKFEVIWLYRYDIDITPEKVERWSDDLPPDLKALLVCGERKVQWIDENGEKQPFITFVALSKYGVGKGTPYPNVEILVFDEFIADEDSRYLKNEIFAFKQWIQSIFRTRQINIVMLANSLTIDNPYFNYFKIKRVPEKEFFKNKKVVCQFPPNNVTKYDKSNLSLFSSLFDDDETKAYDILGQFYFDTSEFIISQKPKNAKPLYMLVVNKGIYTVYSAGKYFWVTKRDTQNLQKYSILKNDIANGQYIPELQKALFMALSNQELWFDCLQTRNVFTEVLK